MTRVATANILYKLPMSRARVALRQVMDAEPDLIGLQEWYPTRIGLLLDRGTVHTAPAVPGLSRLLRDRPGPAYHWISSLACGNVVGARADRFDLLGSTAVLLSGIGRSDRPDRALGIEPPRLVTVGVFADRQVERTITLMSYHLCPGVERNAHYIPERPLVRARHQQEVHRLEALIAEQQRAGHAVYAVGDSNFHLQRLAGLTSAWEGREDAPGTIGTGTRKLDDVHGPGSASAVRVLETPSDHRAVIADWDD
jgi:hypothetical protein